jgi:glycosyltransferase involved in cell wall biosynthesis
MLVRGREGVRWTDRMSPYRPLIAPVPEGVPRPLWSVMIPTFNCAGYLREALTSVLAQDPGPRLMQIEVVDDCSTKDDPGAVVAELGKGRVQFHRRSRNDGHTANFRTCLERSRGRLVHLLHGDDAVRDVFFRNLQAVFDSRREIGAAF